MANKSRKQGSMAPLQEFELVPITDPAKQAALDEQRRQGRDDTAPVRTRGAVKVPGTATVAEVLDLSRQLSPEERFSVLVQLADELSAEQLQALLQRYQAPLAR
jgi:hypothetical protein